jgi:hypothetical protein
MVRSQKRRIMRVRLEPTGIHHEQSSGGLRQERRNGRSAEGDPESRLWVAEAGRTHGRVNGPAREQ